MIKKNHKCNNKRPLRVLIIVLISIILIVVSVIVFSISTNFSISTSFSNSIKTCTTFHDEFPEQCLEDYIGLTKEEATNRASQNGYRIKVGPEGWIDRIDACTNVLISNPGILVEVKDGIVIKAEFDECHTNKKDFIYTQSAICRNPKPYTTNYDTCYLMRICNVVRKDIF